MSDDGGVGGLLGCLLGAFLAFWGVKIGCILLALIVLPLIKNLLLWLGG
ncbi:MAG: hypothetical protein K8R59_04895 [Thermoanaerobaculales bacterium]|nr:hypothetical protein [Thermoanaerobaculales bacterium]